MLYSEAVASYEFYKDGFFGYGDKGDFKIFSLAYFIPIILLVSAIILTYIFRDFFKKWKYERNARIVYAAIMMIVEMSYFWRLIYVGAGNPSHTNLMSKLPIQICQWTLILSIFMVACEVKFAFDVDVFVCLTFGLVPFLYPAVIMDCGPRYYRYYQFYLEHMMPVYAVFYMMFVKEYKIDIKKIYMPLSFIAILMIPSAIANATLDNANFMYFGSNTTSVSICNVLHVGMPVAIILELIFAGLAFTLDYFVFRLVSKMRTRKA